LLADQKATRRHLMERVLHGRTYLSLPAYPLPGLTGVEDDKDFATEVTENTEKEKTAE